MTKLTEPQTLILVNAAHHPDGIAAPPASLPPAPRGAVAKVMIKAGLLEIAEGVESQHPGLARKLDGQAVFLRITEAGRLAIGGERDAAANDARQTPLWQHQRPRCLAEPSDACVPLHWPRRRAPVDMVGSPAGL